MTSFIWVCVCVIDCLCVCVIVCVCMCCCLFGCEFVGECVWVFVDYLCV